MQYQIPQPDKKIFENESTAQEAVIKENTACYLIERIEYNKGIQTYYFGCTHPKKGFPTPEATVAINLCKKVLMQYVLVSKKYPPLTLRPIKTLNTLLRAYYDVCYSHIRPFFLKDEYLTPFALGLKKGLAVFLQEIGIDFEVSNISANIFAHIFEYDCAYRYRAQDILDSLNYSVLMQNPRKELARLIEIFVSRETDARIKAQAQNFGFLIRLILVHPKIKKAFLKALQGINLASMSFDMDDSYWVSSRPDYNFFGKTLEERMEGKEMPQLFTVVI